MSKQIEFEYDVGDQIEIIQLKRPGYVLSLWYGQRGITYEVAYWSDGDRKSEYLFAFEIKMTKGQEGKTGFSQTTEPIKNDPI